jgi:hypothetical protein
VPFWSVRQPVVDVLTEERLDRIGGRLSYFHLVISPTCTQMAMFVLSASVARKLLHSNPYNTSVHNL